MHKIVVALVAASAEYLPCGQDRVAELPSSSMAIQTSVAIAQSGVMLLHLQHRSTRHAISCGWLTSLPPRISRCTSASPLQGTACFATPTSLDIRRSTPHGTASYHEANHNGRDRTSQWLNPNHPNPANTTPAANPYHDMVSSVNTHERFHTGQTPPSSPGGPKKSMLGTVGSGVGGAAMGVGKAGGAVVGGTVNAVGSLVGGLGRGLVGVEDVGRSLSGMVDGRGGDEGGERKM